MQGDLSSDLFLQSDVPALRFRQKGNSWIALPGSMACSRSSRDKSSISFLSANSSRPGIIPMQMKPHLKNHGAVAAKDIVPTIIF
ncbi:hypothetical protein [Mangrovicoccus ximenensis]|uniref:hypothetical protein n=1 Tax=Mangrovicoccus ximenensis TaxID=1911570 RepID=UPI000D35247C|nr:hypothetical protein [Mangrovicoccus ximenensis]